MKIDNKQQLEKIILIAIGVAIVIIIFIFFILNPNLSRIRELSAKINEEKVRIENAESDIQRLSALKLNIKKLEEKVKGYQGDIPRDNPEWLLDKINSLANEADINFNKIEPRGEIFKLDNYSLYGLHIELETDYHRFGMFVNKLENSSPFLNVLDFSINSNKSDVKKHLIKLDIGAYVKKDN